MRVVCRFAGVVLVLLAAVLPWSPVRAQRLPVEPGDRVRVAVTDSAELGRWLEVNVVAATRMGVLLSSGSFGTDTIPLALNPSVRLAVRRKRGSSLILGTLGGLGFGVSAGAMAPPNTLGGWWGEKTPGHRAEMIYFGLAGTLLGWTASWLFAPPRWQEIPLTADGFAFRVAPLTRASDKRARFGKLERWQVFPATEDDFAAFFWAHRDSLEAIEGIWELLPVGEYDDRVAIARDDRYHGWEYVAVSLPRRGSFDRPQGRIVWALRRRPEPGRFDLHEVDSPNLARVAVRQAAVQDDVLQVRYPFVREWGRVQLSPRQ